MFQTDLSVDAYETDFFKIWYDVRHNLTLHFDTSVNDLGTKSQGSENSRSCKLA